MTVRTGVDVAIVAEDLATPAFGRIEMGMDRMAETAEDVGGKITDRLGESVVGGIAAAFAGAAIDRAFESVLEGIRAEESGIDIGVRFAEGVVDGLQQVPIAGQIGELLSETLRPTIDDVLGYAAGRLQQLFPEGRAREFLQGVIDTPSDIDRRLEESRQRSAPNDADRLERERFERDRLDRERQEARERERQAAEDERQRLRQQAEEERQRERERREREAEAERVAREQERVTDAVRAAESRTPDALESRSLQGRAQAFVASRGQDAAQLAVGRQQVGLLKEVREWLRRIADKQTVTLDFR